MNFIRKFLIIATCIAGLSGYEKAMAAKPGEVSTTLEVHDHNGIFSSSASFTFTVNNGTNADQTGSVSYLVTTEKNEKLLTNTQKVKISKNSSENYDFNIPGLKSGFYKINFMVNVSDYDDTTQRVFGIRPEEIRSATPKPADFEQFWQNAKDELAKVKPEFKMTELKDSTKDHRRVFEIEMKSIDNLTIRGYMTVPITSNTHKKFAVLLGLPGYQVGLSPMFGTDEDLAVITLNVRGQGNSSDVLHRPRDEFIFYHLDDRNKYVMRGVIMDCVRCIDFIFSRPELNHDQIEVSGGSMGGFLSLATASLDRRVALCASQNPILTDVHHLDGIVDWPITDIKKYVRTVPGLTLEKVLNNLEYFDTKNFATNITCPTLLGIGLLDNFVPPSNAFALYNNITAKKHIIIFKNLGHEVSTKYKDYEGRWSRDAFGLF